MSIQIIEERIASYKPTSKTEEVNALKEIAQEITLCALSRANLFKKAVFLGGTCLRILYGLPRFSEDLDFILLEPDPNFIWQPYFAELKLEFAAFGLTVSATDRSNADSTVKRAFIKEDSFGTILNLSYPRTKADVQTIKIKLEIDTNPPLGSKLDGKLVDFPIPFSVITQDLSSLFAGKIHALLCREYVKGRDWYDFIWYIIRQTPINYTFLRNALVQQGIKTIDTNVELNKTSVSTALKQKIAAIDWRAATADVAAFIPIKDHHSLHLWNNDFFQHYLDKMNLYLGT